MFEALALLPSESSVSLHWHRLCVSAEVTSPEGMCEHLLEYIAINQMSDVHSGLGGRN